MSKGVNLVADDSDDKDDFAVNSVFAEFLSQLGKN
jgi:hypothetical protein